MKQSKLFGKTVKSAKKDMQFASHKLLYQGGFVRESTAGRYYFLPLGMRVRNKVIGIIREEMNKSGGQEVLTPTLHPLELWEETNRDNAAGFELMQVTDRRNSKFVLGGTAEEMMVALVRQFDLSYRDLPFNIYQFSQKFRDELRARGGLLRVREFTMKDAYSFHTNAQDFIQEYKNMEDTYVRIFKRLGLETRVVEADNGYIGGEYCHELIADSHVGESTYFVTDDGMYQKHEDVADFAREEVNPQEELKDFEIIEQPAWVKTMEDNEKHYGLPASRFLKNVVYKNRVTKEILIAVIRGDLEVNKTKLEQKLGLVGVLEEATEEDLHSIGTKPGYVHSWGHENNSNGIKVRYVGDLSLTSVKNFIGGQKEESTDSRNVNYGRDFECEQLFDIALAKEGYKTHDGKTLIQKKGIEVGNIFQLGCHYTTKMSNATFAAEDGSLTPFYMGCYGIGIGRTIATIAEIYNDDKGLVWPKEIAPFVVHLVALNLEEVEVKEQAEQVYKVLLDKGIEVLFDDRESVTAGEKFADADLIGCPYRVVVSKRTSIENLEVKERSKTEVTSIAIEDLLQVVLS
ncbi:proline--tRNA ligase [candidate division WWE3 bacterium]|uniref:Proline--tRNA ligase n=1 Tax=candidate division WWE3 bacterium TaxID=2053526 RepID=A0A955J201_UNCKA|nr:proline--tRNA ligase [candidate division WWE3 bacterium]